MLEPKKPGEEGGDGAKGQTGGAAKKLDENGTDQAKGGQDQQQK